MQTLIFDIDGTLTNLWPLERAVLVALPGTSPTLLDRYYQSGQRSLPQLYRQSSGQSLTQAAFYAPYRETLSRLWAASRLPKLQPYRAVGFIRRNASSYRFAYATGGLALEADYALDQFGLTPYFDLPNSISRDTSRFAKSTGIPFRRLARQFPDSHFFTDSPSDVRGANLAGLPVTLLIPNSPVPTPPFQ